MEHVRAHGSPLVVDFYRRLAEYQANPDRASEFALTEAIRAKGESDDDETALAVAFERAYRDHFSFRTHSIALAFEHKLGLAKRGKAMSWWSVGLRLIPEADKWLRQSAIQQAFGKGSFRSDYQSSQRQYVLMPGLQEIRDVLFESISEDEIILATNLCIDNILLENKSADFVEYSIADLKFVFLSDPWIVSRALSTSFASDQNDFPDSQIIKLKMRTSILDWWSSIGDPAVLIQIEPVIQAWNDGLSPQEVREIILTLERPLQIPKY